MNWKERDRRPIEVNNPLVTMLFLGVDSIWCKPYVVDSL